MLGRQFCDKDFEKSLDDFRKLHGEIKNWFIVDGDLLVVTEDDHLYDWRTKKLTTLAEAIEKVR